MDENIITPVFLSASRETDIPAFYADWFVSRLREGWCGWKNTYSGLVHKVSFDKTRMIVFWSKNPKPILERLDEIEALGFRQYYFPFSARLAGASSARTSAHTTPARISAATATPTPVRNRRSPTGDYTSRIP